MGHRSLWYEEWFNSPYYHRLYQNRNQQEAEAFLRTILNYLKPEKDSYFLDMACGRGRHVSFLGKLGYRVHGVDLSPENIDYASRFASEKVTLELNDFRKINHKNAFDYILSLYTSFGYFEADSQNMEVLEKVKTGLKDDGIFVFDFLNPVWVKNNIVLYEKRTIDDCTFEIRKQCFDHYILKTIEVTDNNKKMHFTEYVKLYNLGLLKYMLEEVGLVATKVFGDYFLDDYHPDHSERIIIIAKKENA